MPIIKAILNCFNRRNMNFLTKLSEITGTTLEATGVLLIISGAVYSTLVALYYILKKENKSKVYGDYRRSLGSAILLGLELLVAGDIIRTVAVEPSFTSVGILAAIVMIRTFLSFTLEVEMSGKWPWQK